MFKSDKFRRPIKSNLAERQLWLALNRQRSISLLNHIEHEPILHVPLIHERESFENVSSTIEGLPTEKFVLRMRHLFDRMNISNIDQSFDMDCDVIATNRSFPVGLSSKTRRSSAKIIQTNRICSLSSLSKQEPIDHHMSDSVQLSSTSISSEHV
jgi:hypothetical protein